MTLILPHRKPTLNQLAPAIFWLRQRGVGSDRLAVAFRTTRNHIRVLVHRGRQWPFGAVGATVPSGPVVSLQGRESGLPPYEDEAPLGRLGRARLERLEEEIETVARSANADWLLEDAIMRLRRFSSRLGRPHSVRLLRLRARIRMHLASCFVHSGLTHSACLYGLRSIDDLNYAFRETGDAKYLGWLGEAALIASNAQLLRRRPNHADTLLQQAVDASAAAATPLGSEYYRQRGVAAFQRGEDLVARSWFTTARSSAISQSAFTIAEFASVRHLAALRPIDWDAAASLLAQVRHRHRVETLEAAMMSHWAVATAFSTDSPRIFSEGVDLLFATPPPEARFGHQSTVRELLIVTPELKLNEEMRIEWLRWLMYANAFARQ